MALVTALNKRTKRLKDVPAHYVDNPRIFGGVWTKPPADNEAPAQNAPDADAPADKPADGGKSSDPKSGPAEKSASK